MNRKILLILMSVFIASCNKNQQAAEGERISFFEHDKISAINNHIHNPNFASPTKIKNWHNNKFIINNKVENIYIQNQTENFQQKQIKNFTAQHNRILSSVIAEDILVSMDGKGKVIAYSLAENKTLWTYNTTKQKDIIGGGMAIDAYLVYVTDGYNNIYALDLFNGELIWEKKIDNIIKSQPIASHGNIYILTQDNHTYALNQATGEIVWFHIGSSEIYGDIRNSSLNVKNDILIAPYSSGEVFALNPEDGEILWNSNLAFASDNISLSMQAFQIPPIIDESNIFLATNSGKLFCLDLKRGFVKWKIDIPRVKDIWQTTDYLFILYQNNRLLCVNKNNKEIIWNKNISEDIVLYENKNNLSKRSMDRQIKQTSSNNYNNLIMVKNDLILTDDKGSLITISALTGEIVRVNKIISRVYNNISFNKDKLIIINNYGVIQQ